MSYVISVKPDVGPRLFYTGMGTWLDEKDRAKTYDNLEAAKDAVDYAQTKLSRGNRSKVRITNVKSGADEWWGAKKIKIF